MHIKIQNLVGCLIVPLLSVASFAASTGDTGLVEAAKNRDKEAVRALLTKHVNVNAPEADGATALAWAAHWDDAETADLLIRAGANVDAANDLGVTPLYLACANGDAVIVEKLLAAGANPSATAVTGVSPLMEAARSGSVDAVRSLLSHGANIDAKENSRGQTALMWAVAERHPDVVRVLVEHGANINARSQTGSLLVNLEGGVAGEDRQGHPQTVQTGGSTALLFAARQGCVECAKILLDGGANVNDTAPDGHSALVLAAHSGQGAVAALLLDRGANANADGAGYTALHAAVLRGDLDLVKALLAHGANPNARTTNGTPRRRESADFALPVSLIGTTPYLLAAKYASVDMMQVLVASGADPKLVANNKTTPLMAAAGPNRRPGAYTIDGGGNGAPPPEDESHALEAVKLALDLGGRDAVNATDEAGNTALHFAASRGYDSVVQLLATNGANLGVKNRKGQTPLALTLHAKGSVKGQPQFKNTVDLLRKLGATE